MPHSKQNHLRSNPISNNLSQNFNQTKEPIFQDKKIPFINSSSKKNIQNYRQFQKIYLSNSILTQPSEQKQRNKLKKKLIKSQYEDDNNQKNKFVRQCTTKLQIDKYLKEYESIGALKKDKKQIQKREKLTKRYQKRKIEDREKIKQRIIQRINMEIVDDDQISQQQNLTERTEKLKGFIERQQFFEKQRKILREMRQFCTYGKIKAKQGKF